MPRVNPNILIWARETAGLSREDAAEKLNVYAAYDYSPVERMERWETGEDEPTRALLVKMAKQYRRPLLTFYMSEPPIRGERGEDFRTLPDAIPASQNALVDALVRQTRARQSMVKAALIEAEEDQPLAFVGSFQLDTSITAAKDRLAEIFDIDIVDFRRERTPEKAFNYLRSKVEAKNVFVLLAGNLGSHHTNLDTEIFRGFALADDVAPFVVINDLDSKAALSFTLLHELVHLLLGETGISGSRAETRVEKFCNDVASEVLFPAAEIRTLFEEMDFANLIQEEAQELISQYARARNVSASMLAYKLYRMGMMEEGAWSALSAAFRAFWLNARDKRRASRDPDGTGPSYYVVKRHKLGNSLVSVVDRMMSAGILSTTRAGKILDVRPKNVEHLFARPTAVSAGQR